MNETTTMDTTAADKPQPDALVNLTQRFHERAAALPVDPAAAMDEIVAGVGAEDDIQDIVEQALAQFLEEERTGTGIEEILGRDETEAERGRWFLCSELGEPGSFWRRLPAGAEVLIAMVPNKRFNSLIDLIYRKWHLRHRNQPLPNDKIRSALPVIYADAVFRGIRGWKLFESDPQAIKDTARNRKWLLDRYTPQLLNAVEAIAEDLDKFKSATAATVRPPDA